MKRPFLASYLSKAVGSVGSVGLGLIGALAVSATASLVACGSKSNDDGGGTTIDDAGKTDAGVTTIVPTEDAGTTVITGDDSGTVVVTSTDAGDDDAGVTTPVDSGTPSTAHHPVNTAPTKTCSTKADATGDGYISLTSSAGAYFVHLPTGYTASKYWPVIIGSHGCGDSAEHFDDWAINAYSDNGNGYSSDIAGYIAVSVEDVSGGCWNLSDTDKIIAALDDLTACYAVDNARVTMAGYSSGAAAAYQTALSHAERFNGLLISEGALYDTGSAEDSLLANATWKINITALDHDSDDEYPESKVEPDWAKIKAAGFPLTGLTGPGDHDATYTEWAQRLIPTCAGWTAPE